VHQNSYLDFPTAVVISLSRCDFPAVISAQKKSAETVCPEKGTKLFIQNHKFNLKWIKYFVLKEKSKENEYNVDDPVQ
jgi:hypothetical protein